MRRTATAAVALLTFVLGAASTSQISASAQDAPVVAGGSYSGQMPTGGSYSGQVPTGGSYSGTLPRSGQNIFGGGTLGGSYSG